MVSKLLIALFMIVNTGSTHLILIMGLGVSVCIRFTVTEHSLKVRGGGGLSGMVHFQPVSWMTGHTGPILTFGDCQEEPHAEKLAFAMEPGK